MKNIAFIGVGLMGSPMASRLHVGGLEVTLWNRTSEKVAHLIGKGMRVASSAQEAVIDSDIVITMLANGPAVSAILFDDAMIEGLARRTTPPVVIDMSSIPPALARDHAERLSSMGVAHLDAPVSGGTKAAEAGTLAIMVGGEKATFEAVQAIFDLLGHATLVGPSGTGQLAKLANQVIVGTTIAAVAEALLIAKTGGADPAKVAEALAGGFADSPILRQHGQRMLDRNFTPGGLLSTQVKDLRTIMATAAQLAVELPLAARTTVLFEDAMANGYSDHDHSAIYLELERRQDRSLHSIP